MPHFVSPLYNTELRCFTGLFGFRTSLIFKPLLTEYCFMYMTCRSQNLLEVFYVSQTSALCFEGFLAWGGWKWNGKPFHIQRDASVTDQLRAKMVSCTLIPYLPTPLLLWHAFLFLDVFKL